MLDKGISHVLDGTEWDSARFYQTTQNDARFETYELFISGIFNNIFGPQSATGNETADKGDYYIMV